MRSNKRVLQSAAWTDVMFLIGVAPSSLAPVSIAEMHLYAYLANVVALAGGAPVSDWGYRFSITVNGFPFAHDLEIARENLVLRSIVREEGGHLWPGDNLFEAEISLLEQLVQSGRRKAWLGDALACALQLPRGAIRDAINHSPGVATSLRDRRASALLKEAEVEEIYGEFKLVRDVLGPKVEDLLEPVVVWLSARVMAKSKP